MNRPDRRSRDKRSSVEVTAHVWPEAGPHSEGDSAINLQVLCRAEMWERNDILTAQSQI